MEAHIFLLVLLCKAAFPQPDDDDYYANTPSDDDYEYDPLNPFIRTTTGKPVRESAKHRFRDRRPFATPCHQNEDRVCARNCSLRPECRMDCYINGDDPSYQVCTLKRGCVCGSGFVRDTNLDLCITRADCNRIRFEPRCPETEVYHRHEATECPRYCKISHKLGECQKTLPRSGCICPPPRIRDWTFGYMDCVTNETCVLRQSECVRFLPFVQVQLRSPDTHISGVLTQGRIPAPLNFKSS